jgi:hypothetical protein
MTPGQSIFENGIGPKAIASLAKGRRFAANLENALPLTTCAMMAIEMRWRVRVITKRKRKMALRIKANSIEELAGKLSRHATKVVDFEIENPVNDAAYWKSLILTKLFEVTHAEDENLILPLLKGEAGRG